MNEFNDQILERTQSNLNIYGSERRQDPMQDMMEYLQDYARQNPGSAALWCLGIGFVLGWKLKPW